MGKRTAANRQKRVVVIGAGFGGLEFCKRFKHANAEIILIDRQNHHLFQPLLYQVATAGLAIPDIAQPIREILRKRKDIIILLEDVDSIDLDAKTIGFESGEELEFDYLVLAMGAQTNYFGNDDWESYAPGLKTVDDAATIRHNVLLAFEKAESHTDTDEIRKLMTLVVIGGGPTGVEMAGALSELARNVLSREFRRINPSEAKVILVEGGDRILGHFPEDLSTSAENQLKELGVEIITGERVTDISSEKVSIGDRVIEASNIIWTAGVSANPLTEQLGVELDRTGRI